MTSLLPAVAHAFVAAGGKAVQRVDLVIMGALALLLLEYDLLRVYFGQRSAKRVRPLGIAILPLVAGSAIAIVHRWRQLSG
jgi:hypothetical protein